MLNEENWDPAWWGPEERPENHRFTRILSEVVYGQENVIDVGCGPNKTAPRVLGVDAYSDAADVRAFMWDMPFEDESIDGLVCMHALEHISKFQVIPTLQEFQRILKPGARFVILVPDLISAMEKFAANPNVGWEMDIIFGSQTDEGQVHKTGFTEDIFRAYWQFIPDCEIIEVFRPHAYSQENIGIYAKKKEKE